VQDSDAMVDYSAVFVLQTSNLLFCLLVEEFLKSVWHRYGHMCDVLFY